jgi:hypothetical protein
LIREALRQVLPSGVSLVSGEEVAGGLPSENIRSEIERADLVLVDITGNNPNIMYELGFAHGLKKKVAVLVDARATAEQPTDLAGFSYLPYETTDQEKLRGALRGFLAGYFGLRE